MAQIEDGNLKAELNPVKLQRVLLIGGLTIEEVAQQYAVTGEAVRRLCDFSVREQRKPLWYAVRLGHPELGDKEIFLELLHQAGSGPRLARQLGLKAGMIVRQAKRLGISLSGLHTTKVNCANCGASIERTKAEIKKAQKIGQIDFYCFRSCYHQGIAKQKGFFWTPAEDKFLKRHYSQMSDRALAKSRFLKRKTRTMIINRRNKLGLKKR